jgi:BolA protein
MSNESRIALIKERLAQTLSPSHLVVVDESYQHLGHEGAKTGLGHFCVEISSDMFTGKSLLEKHRMIYKALGDLMQTDIHALRIVIL